jgi:hypothetical protein
MMLRPLVAGSLLLVVTRCAFADYEYRYIEGEAFNRGDAQGVREEGFTSWMAHPSGGKVAVFGKPAGGFLEYDIEGLQDGDYTIRIRCLALPTTKTRVLWDGKDLGFITHEQAGTSLRWSKPIGPVQGAGKHVLRLQGSDDTTQPPYVDVILLTNVNQYAPPARDQNFVRYRTAWPPLELKLAGGPQLVAPLPPLATPQGSVSTPAALSGIRVLTLGMAPPVLGQNQVQLTLSSAKAASISMVSATRAIGSQTTSGQPVEVPVRLAVGTPQTVTLPVVASSTGPDTVVIRVGAGNERVEGQYALDIPRIAAVALDEYAYPSTQGKGHWSAALTAAPGTLPSLTVDFVIQQLPAGETLLHETLPAHAQVDVPIDLSKLPVGRFRADANFQIGGQRVQGDSLEFIKFAMVSPPPPEPIRQSKAEGDRITVNGRPFQARLLYHAAPEASVVDHGFNAVQCAGFDPDPLPGIQDHLDACQKVGLYGCVALFNNQYFNKGKQFDLARLQEAVLRFKDHPALLCWDLFDEPDCAGMPPVAVQGAADLIRRFDPNHFVWVNLCHNTGVTDYLASQDLWSYDYYPFPQGTPFEYKARWLDRTDTLLAGRKPLGVCLQTYNYNRNEQRMPTPDELRTSAWLHILHGYKWFGYYSYTDHEPAGCLSHDPVLFSYTRALNAELVQLQDVILAPGAWEVVPMVPKTSKLEAREKQVGGKLYVVIVSDSREPLKATLSPSWANAQRRRLIESEMKPIGGPFETTVGPEATQVWELAR